MDIDIEIIQEYILTFGLNIAIALAIFIVGKKIAKLAVVLSRKGMKKSKIDPTLISFLSNIIYGLIITFVAISALDRLGVQTASLAAILAAVGLAVGLALQGSLSNFAAGVMVILFRPFKIGDFVEVAGVSGVVKDISIFTTTIKTGDNKTIISPNASITSKNIINYSTEETRRVDMVFGCGYGDDIKKVKELLLEIASKDDRILKTPETLVAVAELADNSVNFNVRVWVKSADYWAVLYQTNETVKLTFDKQGLSIPYPQHDVHLHQVTDKT
ncbi:MAG: small conductance mechanosensitive channel [Alphaproteobacteria bacterium]|jgi:small conductance mechanosensitive channel